MLLIQFVTSVSVPCLALKVTSCFWTLLGQNLALTLQNVVAFLVISPWTWCQGHKKVVVENDVFRMCLWVVCAFTSLIMMYFLFCRKMCAFLSGHSLVLLLKLSEKNFTEHFIFSSVRFWNIALLVYKGICLLSLFLLP